MAAALATAWAFEGTAAAAGLSMSWNPIGWIIDIVVIVVAVVLVVATVVAAVVLIIDNWDAICAFCTWIGEEVVAGTNWVAATALGVWDAATAVEEKAEKKVKNWAKELAALIAAGTVLIRKWNVYQIVMAQKGRYQKRTWGFGWNIWHNYPADCNGDKTFKYGITIRNTVPERYTSGYIGRQLALGRLAQGFFNGPYDALTAKVEETGYIAAYFASHLTFPPGNSKLG